MYPRRFGYYELLSKLGDGGMGTVHLGRAPDGRIVAVKTMNRLAAESKDGLRRFAREVAALQKVDDPHVAAYVAADLTGPDPYLVTEYVQGRTLHDILAAGPLGSEDLGRLGLGLARAFDALHGAGLVHRDVKPANIIMARGEPVLIDLGIVHHIDITRITTGPIGTWRYMAPEALTNKKPTAAADVFGWGAVMAHAATGRPCFDADSVPAVVHQICSMDPDLSRVPDWLRDIVGRALAKEPLDRPSVRSLRDAMARRPQVDLLQTAYAEARAAYEHARAEGIAFALHAMATAAGDQVLAARSLLDQAHAARYSGMFDRAEELFKDAQAASSAVGARQDEGWAWDGLGVCRYRRKAYAPAEEAFRAALTIAEEIGDAELRAWNLCNIASLALRDGDTVAAAAYYDEARDASRDHPQIESEALKGRARTAQEQGDHEMAESLMREAAQHAEARGDMTAAGWAWYDLAEVAGDRGADGPVHGALVNALRIAVRIEDRLMEGWALCKIADYFAANGDIDEATTAYVGARAVADSLQDKGMWLHATNALKELPPP